MTLFLRLLFLVLTSVFLTESALTKVTVNKCCRKNEFFSKERKCVRDEGITWDQKVYVPAKKSYITYKANLPQHWSINENSIPICRNKPKIYFTFVPFQNGSVWLVSNDVMVHPNDYCLDYKNTLLVCENDVSPDEMSRIKIKKCCGKDAIFYETNKTCVHIKEKGYGIEVGQDVTLIEGFPQCESGFNFAFPGKLNEAKMQSNGSLWIKNIMIPVDNYCLEHVMENANQFPTIMACQESLVNAVSMKPTGDLRFTLYPIGLAISAIFLTATLVAGSLLPASHHVLHWRCQTNHVACLLVGDVLLAVTQLFGDTWQSAPWACIIIAVTMHFVFLAAFFWLNTMCFNIWWTFRDLRPQSTEKSQERCRLRLYEVYAWGCPLIIAGTATIIDNIPNNDGLLSPRFGQNTCWFSENSTTEMLTFFFGPMGVLLFVNLALFIATARELTCGLWKRELVKSTSERAALGRVCMKLVVVMGITWVADIISWAVGGPQELWYVTDLINCLQGVFIFIVVGCQPQVLSAVKRLWCVRRHRDNRNGGTTNHHSSSSQGIPSMGDTVTNNSVTNTTTKSAIPLETSW